MFGTGTSCLSSPTQDANVSVDSGVFVLRLRSRLVSDAERERSLGYERQRLMGGADEE